jgi:hypothetical protein
MGEFFSAEICRDEDCDVVGVHPAHPVVARKIVAKGDFAVGPGVWRKHSVPAITNAVARAVSPVKPRNIVAITNIVHNDYGDCNVRTIYRHLGKLVERGHVLRVDLGERLYAYLRPNTRYAHDIAYLREQLEIGG